MTRTNSPTRKKLLISYYRLNEEAKELEKRKKVVKQRLLDEMGKLKTEALTDGEYTVTLSTVNRTTLNKAKVRVYMGDKFKHFLNHTTYTTMKAVRA